MQTITRWAIVAAMTLGMLLAPVDIKAQQTSWLQNFTVPGIGTPVNPRNSRITFSRVIWYFLGPITSCSFKIEQSDFGVTWEDLVPERDCSTEGNHEFITTPLNKVIRFNVSALAGGGIVSLYWEGFTGEKCGKDYDGILTTVLGSDPAAGEELSITVPPGERWRVHSAVFKLQTTTDVGDREVFLTASEGGDTYFRTFADGVVKADQTGVFTTANLGFVGTVGLGPLAIAQPTATPTIMIPIYSQAFIPSGDTLATETNGLETGPAGDDYSPVVIKAEICPN